MPRRRNMVQMSLRVLEHAEDIFPALLTHARPTLTLERKFFMDNRKWHASIALNKNVFTEDETIKVYVNMWKKGGHKVKTNILNNCTLSENFSLVAIINFEQFTYKSNFESHAVRLLVL